MCITTPDEARALAGWELPSERTRTTTDDSGTAAARVIDALSYRVPRDVDDLARRTGIAVSDVQSTLGILVLEGHVVRESEGFLLVKN